MKEKHAERYLWTILIAVLIAVMTALYCTSCSTQEQLCKPHFADGEIIEVTDTEVTTINYLGYEIPHRIHKSDTTTYIVGEILILNR